MAVPNIGYSTVRILAGKICKVLVRHTGLITAISAQYPTVAAALTALVTACEATGFTKVPEVGSLLKSEGL